MSDGDRLADVLKERDALRRELSATRDALEVEKERTAALEETIRLDRRTSPRAFQDIEHIKFLTFRLEQDSRAITELTSKKVS